MKTYSNTPPTAEPKKVLAKARVTSFSTFKETEKIMLLKNNGNFKFVEQVQEYADMHVVFDHSVSIFVLAGNPDNLRLQIGAEMHTSTVPPNEPWHTFGSLRPDELNCSRGCFVVDIRYQPWH